MISRLNLKSHKTSSYNIKPPKNPLAKVKQYSDKFNAAGTNSNTKPSQRKRKMRNLDMELRIQLFKKKQS